MHKINAKMTSCSYDVNIKDNLSDAFVQTLEKSNYDKIFILTNELIQSLHSKHEIFNQGYKIIPVNNNEEIKNITEAEKIIEQLILKGCTRSSLIIGVGGGSITDFTGFIASIFMRGIDHAFVPTTLLGMVDAAIGGKTGVNTLVGKNLIGTFKQPKSVYIDSLFLNTLDKKQIINGFSEIVKYGLICDANLYEQVEENFYDLITLINKEMLNDIIIQCCNHKVNVVGKDEFETNQRMILNFGHTIGHALESYHQYQNIDHGDAVYYGMIGAGFISFKLNYLSEGEFKRINQFIKSIQKFKLKNINVEQLFHCMKYDKKQLNNNQHFILLNTIGKTIIEKNISKELIMESLNFITKV